MIKSVLCDSSSADVINPHTESLNSIFIEYIDGSRLFFELEADKEIPTLSLIRLHFSKFIHHLILNTPGLLFSSRLGRFMQFFCSV